MFSNFDGFSDIDADLKEEVKVVDGGGDALGVKIDGLGVD
jgi:hypothetical protein